MKPGDKCDLNFLTVALELRKTPGKILNQEIDPTGNRTQVRLMEGNEIISRP